MSKMNLAKAMHRLHKEAGGGKKGATLVAEAFKSGDFKLGDFSLKALALTTMGDDWKEALTPDPMTGRFQESGSVDSSAFLHLANQVLTGVVRKEFEESDINVGDGFAETRDVPFIQQGRDIEITRTDAESLEVREGRDFQTYGLGENWQTYPDTVKRGAILELTKEAIDEDRTGTIIQQAQGVADEVAMEKNERILKVVLGINNSVWLPQGVATAHYATTAGRKNLLTGNELVDWTDVDAALQLWAEMTHPVTGRPINITSSRMRVLVMPAKLATANYVFNSTDLERGTVTDAAGLARGVNPVRGLVGGGIGSPEASRLAYYLLTLAAASGGGGVAADDAKKYWYVGDFAGAFVYLQNYGLQVITRGADTEAAFRRDVVFSIRAAERGVMAVKEPRLVAKFTG